MTPEHYCLQKAAPLGSAFYYSLRKLPKSERVAVAAVAAFYQEIEEVVFECHDIAVAQAKLNWWREEITKEKPDHPVALVLHHIIPRYALPLAEFFKLIEGMEHNLNFLPFATFEDEVIYFIQTAGMREMLIARITSHEATITEPFSEIIYQLTLSLELIHYLQQLHRFVRRDLIFFPVDELTRFQMSAAALHQLKTTPEVRELLRYQAEKAERAYAKAQADMTEVMRKGLGSLSVRCDIALATLKEMQASDLNVLENFIDLTPLRRWWIALWV